MGRHNCFNAPCAIVGAAVEDISAMRAMETDCGH